MGVDPFSSKKPDSAIAEVPDFVPPRKDNTNEIIDRDWVLDKLVELVYDAKQSFDDTNATAALSPRAAALSKILDIVQTEDVGEKKDAYSEDDLQRLEVLLEAGKIDG